MRAARTITLNNNLLFRYNKKRKHYSYTYKGSDEYRHNLLLSSKPVRKVKVNNRVRIIPNIKLYKNPNPNKNDVQYIMTKSYCDHREKFGPKRNWKFHKNDKKVVKDLINKK